MRRILESEAAGKAATKIDRQTVRRLREQAESFRNIEDQSAALRRWADFDDEFHHCIAAASGSRHLEADIIRYRRLHRVFNRVYADPSALTDGLDEHLAILKALEDRDTELARRLMHDHIAEWQRFFVRHLTELKASR
jgi:GntR family transcriptional repressor for pyruvate dehydrogenase complex